MASETLPETLPMQQHTGTRGSSRRRWPVRSLIVIAIIAVLLSATLLIPDADSSPELGPAMTHTIGRGDLLVTVTEQGTLESSNNTEIKCKVRGDNTIIWVIESGTEVKPGDELVKLDTLMIEEEISEHTKYVHLAKSAVARSAADVATAELAISEYLEGRYISD
jgi:HlyD family secretion protein